MNTPRDAVLHVGKARGDVISMPYMERPEVLPGGRGFSCLSYPHSTLDC